MLFNWQVDVDGAGRNSDRLRQQLNGQVLQFDVDRIFDLGKILAGNGDPRFPVFDQVVTASGNAGKIFAEMGSEQVIAG